jgi:hypothetical protein
MTLVPGYRARACASAAPVSEHGAGQKKEGPQVTDPDVTDIAVTGTRSLASFLEGDARPVPQPSVDEDNESGPAAGRIGEVVESSTTTLVAEARRLHGAPDFGAFVRIESNGQELVGVVHNARTQSTEPNRRPMAYGKTEAELRREQPQIFELLRTQFEVFVLGFLDGTGMVHLFPPQPARIHSFVFPCMPEQVRIVTEDPQFLRSILEAPGLPTDELLLATLRHALGERQEDSREYLGMMGAELSRLLRDDYDRLSSLVRRITTWR